ncbi:hypothetical protein ACVWZK_005863 [Bradyrhizobium sp. GM0.4]
MSPNDNRIDARDWSLLTVLSVLWGGSFFFDGAALRELPPLTLVLLRVALGAAILLPLLRIQGIGFPKGIAGWKPFVAIGLLNNVIPFSLIVVGQTFIPSGLASVLNATTPLFTVIVMAAAGEEALRLRRVAGVALGLAGVIILHGWGVETRAGQGLGILLCLGGAFSYGFAAPAARRLLKDSPPLGDGRVSTDGFHGDDGDRGRRSGAAVASPAAGRDDLARGARPCRVVDGARLYRLLPDPAAVGRDQCDAGDTAHSRHRHSSGMACAGRADLDARDRGRDRDRQRIAGDRRARSGAAAARHIVLERSFHLTENRGACQP